MAEGDRGDRESRSVIFGNGQLMHAERRKDETSAARGLRHYSSLVKAGLDPR